MKNIAILGSTGSIGTQTLQVVDEHNEFNVVAITGNNNIELLEEQTRKYKPDVVGVFSEKNAKLFKDKIKDLNIEVVSGMEGLVKVATYEKVETLVTAVVGMVGLVPTVEAIKAKKEIALANKETLVTAGHIIMPLAKDNNVKILPVDSEHSAIFQCLNGENHSEIDKILLTASGGPFLGKSKEYLQKVTLKDALNHPNWSMGAKVTIDSSTLANKGLEVIEAKWLFDVKPDDIEVVIQPQSIIHSMIQFVDGGVMAQLGVPDMKLPIQYALTYPHRKTLSGERIDFYKLGKIDFTKPDTDVFKALRYAYDAIKIGGSMPMIFNLYNEIAVSKFLGSEISYLEISEFINEGMNSHKVIENPSLETILTLEKDIRDNYR